MRTAQTRRSTKADTTSTLPPRHRGFTAIEVLLAIGLMAATAGITIPMYRQYQVYADLDTATEHLVQATHAAQALSQTGKFDSVWGVYFPNGTLYAGPRYAVRNSDKDVSFPLPASIDTDGLKEVTFTRVDGMPSATGQVCIFSTVADGYRTITIGRNGVLTVSPLKSGACSGNAVPPGSSSSSSRTSSLTSSSSSTTSSLTSSSSSTTSSLTSSSSSTTSSLTSSSSSTTSSLTSSSSSSTPGIASNNPGSPAGGTVVGTPEKNDADDGTENQDDREHGLDDSSGENGGGVLPCEVRANLDDRSGKLKTNGTNDVKIKVLGSAITYGAGGPKVDVRISASTDGGNEWSDLYGGRAVGSGDQQTVENLPNGSNLVLRFNGRYSWLFNKTYRSDAGDGHTYILRNGDAVPQYAAFASQQSIEAFLRDYVDSQGKIKIGPRDVIFLVELGTLDQKSSDFQDAVVLATFTEKSATCTAPDKPRLRLSFRRVENTGDGDLKARVYVGPNAVAFDDSQWIPLKDKSGAVIVDNGIVKDVKGVALERGNGWVRIIQHGSHANSSGKEIADIKARFRNAWISSIVNEVDVNASENPTDGIINDTSAGDEFVPGKTKKSMMFYTRVTTDDDGVILYWTDVAPTGANTSSASSVISASSSSAASIATGVCDIPYDVSAGGVLTLKGRADVTVRIAGSDSAYGERGPRVSVRGRISFDNGTSWQELYGYQAVRGGELSVFRNVDSGSQILLSFNGRYSWVFNRTAEAGSGDSHLQVVRKGQTATDLPTLKTSGQLKGYLNELVDGSGQMKIETNEVGYLVEYNDPTHPKYQDAVAVVSIDRPVGSVACSSPTSASSSSSSSSSSSAPVVGTADADNDGVINDQDWCPFNTVLPESVPTEYMSFERLALTQPRGNVARIPVFRSGPRRQVSSYTLNDTHGCSCAQILDAIDDKGFNRFGDHPALFRQMKNLFKFYLDNSRKFGCSESLIKMVSDGE